MKTISAHPENLAPPRDRRKPIRIAQSSIINPLASPRDGAVARRRFVLELSLGVAGHLGRIVRSAAFLCSAQSLYELLGRVKVQLTGE